MSIENRGVPEHPAVRSRKPRDAPSAAARAAVDRRRVELNRDKQYHRIRLTVDGTKRLAALIEPYLLKEFRYKLPQ